MKSKGYMGKILHVDLTANEIREETLADGVYEKYLGGMGLGAYVLHEKIPAGADPLGPDNILGFLPGLLTGTGSFFTGRWMTSMWMIMSKSCGMRPTCGAWMPLRPKRF